MSTMTMLIPMKSNVPAADHVTLPIVSPNELITAARLAMLISKIRERSLPRKVSPARKITMPIHVVDTIAEIVATICVVLSMLCSGSPLS